MYKIEPVHILSVSFQFILCYDSFIRSVLMWLLKWKLKWSFALKQGIVIVEK